ncbi:MAG: hypothetical protein IKF37_02370 [Bacilli bacterium]|nr:hypothetical protein [Bacilli bacterium]
MKKILAILFVILLSACSLLDNNSPKEKVRELLDKYKAQDSAIISELDTVISKEYSGDYKDRYKKLILNQYKNMNYKITDEIIDGDTAVVSVDITVYDYGNAIDNANDYLKKHEEEFYKTDSEEKKVDNDKFLDYKLDLLEEVEDRKTYTVEFTLTKEEKDWVLDDLSNENISKIHGLYTE